MTTIAIISDIHGNMEALQAVLEDIDDFGVEEIHCLGDNIGYGPEPEAVVDALCRRGIVSVLGNHELAATDPAYLKWFNPVARQSLEQSLPRLGAGQIGYIESLQPYRVVSGARLVHGFPPDSPVTYLFQMVGRKLHRAMASLEETICFVGHTHELELIDFNGQGVTRERLDEGRKTLAAGHRYIVNAGSVGQPRDGNKQAKYVLWTPDQCALEIRFVSYDARATADKILRAGLPASHAHRLL